MRKRLLKWHALFESCQAKQRNPRYSILILLCWWVFVIVQWSCRQCNGFPLPAHDKQHVACTYESSITKIAFACELLFMLIHIFNFFLFFGSLQDIKKWWYYSVDFSFVYKHLLIWIFRVCIYIAWLYSVKLFSPITVLILVFSDYKIQ